MSALARPLSIEDLTDIAQIECAVQIDPWTPEQMQAIAPQLESGEYLGSVVVVAHMIVAYLVARLLPDECEILTVGVVKTQQGRGYGYLTIEHLFEMLPDTVRTVHLEVRASNQRAIELYQRVGFERVGLRSGYYRMNPQASDNAPASREDAVLMACPRFSLLPQS